MSLLRVWPPTAFHPPGAAPFPLGEPHVRLYARARQALCDGLAALGLAPGDEVLVPSWHHGSEVEAVLRAGLVPRSYPLTPDLQPDEQVLPSLVGERSRALHLTHYLGFPQDAARWRRWCDRRGLLLVEDAAQAWLAQRDGVPVGTWGDLAVFCLYKSTGLPDGAAATARTALPRPARRGALGLRHLAGPAARAVRARRPGASVYDQASDLAVPERSRGPSLVTRALLPWAGAGSLAAQRRTAYDVLLHELRHLVPAPFDVLPEGASPFGFPVAVRDKKAALQVLRAGQVEALDFWSRPHPAVPGQGVRVDRLRQHLLCLPVHPGLSPSDLDRVTVVARDLDPEPSLLAGAGALTPRPA